MADLILSAIDFGEPDANTEYFGSLRRGDLPIYIRAWISPQIKNYKKFVSGEKFIVTGQKGTGKTAILRYMEHDFSSKDYVTEFIVFKNQITQESDLTDISFVSNKGALIDEEKIRAEKFYYHSIRHVMLAIILSKLSKEKKDTTISNLGSRVIGEDASEAISEAFESIANIVNSAKIDIEKIANGAVSFDPGKYLKKENDRILTNLVKMTLKQRSKMRIFFDEMHFSYRSSDSLNSDSALVRDTILAAQSLNERFARDGVDIVVYVALRSEFLDQPEIAQADINHVIESYGEQISWEYRRADEKHPIFDFISHRIQLKAGKNFSSQRLMNTYLLEINPTELLNYTWLKPRDMVRFFKTAQDVHGNTVVINKHIYKSILRKYCELAWREIRSSLGAFMPAESISSLENCLKKIVPSQLDHSKSLNIEEFRKELNDSYKLTKVNGVKYSIEQFSDILYFMGIYFYQYRDNNNKIVYQQYHRGNTTPSHIGEVRIHYAVARALS